MDGRRGRLTTSGITRVVLAVGVDAGLPGLRPHRLRHTYATRLRQGGADPAQVQALLGHASLDATARYFRAGVAEQVAAVEHISVNDLGRSALAPHRPSWPGWAFTWTYRGSSRNAQVRFT